MAEETFRRVLPILPLVRDTDDKGNGVYLSCLYEPSLSPHFLHFLELLPEEARRKVFFTSNFCRPWTSEQLAGILGANLHHINISIETLRADRYEEITGSRQFESFYRNIHELARLYGEKTGYKPGLRYITMCLKINRDELCGLVKYCAERLHACQHEIRTPYISVYENMSWNRGQLMSPEECARTEEELRNLGLLLLRGQALKYGFPVIMDIHPVTDLVVEAAETPVEHAAKNEDNAAGKPAEAQAADAGNGFLSPEAEAELECCMNREFLFLRFHPDGSCSENVTGNRCALPEEQDAARFYREKLLRLWTRRANACSCAGISGYAEAKQISMEFCFDTLTVNEIALNLSGWCRLEQTLSEEDVLMLVISGKRTKAHVYYMQQMKRPDVPCTPSQEARGFALCADRRELPELLHLTFVVADKRSGRARYRCAYRWPVRI